MFDSFSCIDEAVRVTPEIKKVVVTLGTYKGYEFTRLVRRLLDILPTDVNVLWQTGDTDVERFGISGHYAIPERDLGEAMSEADVVVAHAGVGAALAALEVAKCPVLIPRRASFGEHVDDHQSQIARELSARGLSVSTDASRLHYSDLVEAARKRVVSLTVRPGIDSLNTVGQHLKLTLSH